MKLRSINGKGVMEWMQPGDCCQLVHPTDYSRKVGKPPPQLIIISIPHE